MSQAGLINFEGSDPQIPTTFVTDDGNAVPIANTLELLATTVPAQSIPIQTVGSGNTVTIETQFASSSAASDATQVGFAAFDSADFNVDSNGFVSLAVTPMDNIQSIQVDNATAPGVNPVEPDGSGILTVSGNYVANHAVPIETHSRTLNEFNVEVQLAGSAAATNPLLSGLSHFNNTQFSVDANGFVSLTGGGLAIDTIGVQATSGTGTDPVVPTASGLIEFEGGTVAAGTNPVRAVSTAANTVQIQNQISQALAATDATKIGLCNFDSSAFSVDANGFVTFTGSTTDLHDTRFIVSAGGSSDGANYTTIASAITAATSAGGVQTIMIQPGTYTENLTWPANINLVAHVGDSDTPTVTIIGKLTCTDAGTRTASGIRFQTNSDNILSITGSAATVVMFDNCYINATNATAFNSTTTSTSSQIRLRYCRGDIGTTGITYFTIAYGRIIFHYCRLLNSGSSVTQSTAANSSFFDILYSRFECAISYSSSNLSSIYYSDMRCGGLAVIPITTSGTGIIWLKYSRIEAGSNNAISIGAGTIVNVDYCSFDSSNTNVITGAGTLQFNNLSFTSTSNVINPTTQTAQYSNQAKYKATGQPAFLAYLGTGVTNVTGNGTVYTIIFDTEVYDQDANFNLGTSTFTAPVTGKYLITFSCLVTGTTACSAANMRIVTSNRTYNQSQQLSPGSTSATSGTIAVLADFDAADTATFTVATTGAGSDVGDVSGTTSSELRTHVSGKLCC